MKTYKTYLFSAMALGTIGASLIATEALADHREGRGRGYGKQVVDLYIDAGDRQHRYKGCPTKKPGGSVNLGQGAKECSMPVQLW